MSFPRFVARRALFAVLSVYAVVSATFVLINGPLQQELENQVAYARYCQTRNCGPDVPPPEEMREGFVQARGLDVPIYERYLGWLVDVTTFEWGFSVAYGRPVVDVVERTVPTTLEYVLPGVALGVALGVGFGVVVAFAKDGLLDWSLRTAAYGLLGVPAFMVIYYYWFLSGEGLATVGGFRFVAPSVDRTTLAALTVAASLLAGQLRFSRTAALEQSGRAFVKMLRAKGASRLRLARHVLRNAAVPIVSLSISELLAVLVLNAYVVEWVLRIDGVATASLRGVREPDVALVIWTTLVIAVLGIVANFCQDVLYGYLDPRVRVD